jgi:bifunctional non-homologous end joining protein LigD
MVKKSPSVAAAAAALRPMLASVGNEIPNGDDWVFEPKYDGIRVIGIAHGDAVALFSRNGLEKTQQFPEIAEALSGVAKRHRKGIIVDGEIVALEAGAPARFQQLQSRMHVTNSAMIASHRTESPAAMVLFDLLMDGDEPIVAEPWTVRRKRLDKLFRTAKDPLRLSEVRRDGDEMLHEARAGHWEGIMAKRATAPYRPGERSRDWLKLKIEQRQELVVGGYTEPRNTRAHFGAILLGYYAPDGSFIYAGHTGGGFSGASLEDMYRRLKPLETDRVPFSTKPKTNEKAHWVTPKIVVEVKFSEWTTDGKLRQPIFLGIRDDKNPKDVVREPVGETAMKSARRAKPAAKKRAGSPKSKAKPAAAKYARVLAQLDEFEESGGKGTLQLESGKLDVTNMGKVFFPDSGHTKGDLLRYYTMVAPCLLPAIADRPLVLKRFPNGIKGMAFYQQKAPDEAPPSVRVEPVSDEGLTTQPRLIGGDLATLLYIVQLGAVSVDPWHSRVPDVQNADYSIIDLDPGPKASFERVIQVARWVKEVLDELGIHAVPKTSGASGIHIVMPLGKGVSNDAARMLAELVATTVAERHRKEATVIRAVKARAASSVYVDYLQNIRGKTVAGVYSVRANKGATVSMPLEWDEIREGLSPAQFTIDNAEKRIARVGDLWAKGMKKPNRLEKLLRGK